MLRRNPRTTSQALKAPAPAADCLLHRLQTGDRDALASLFDAHRSVLRGAIRKVVHDGSVADDLMQETFLRALLHADQWRETQGCALQWLLGIAKNRALDYCKSAHYRRNRSQVSPDDLAPAGEIVETRFLHSEREQLVRDAMRNLQPEQREVIELAYFAGLSQSHIAEQLRQPLGTIKGRTRAAFVRLRDSLGQRLNQPRLARSSL